MTSTASPRASRADLLRGLGVLCERPDGTTARLAEAIALPAPSAADHTELFVQQLPPYASIYLGTEGKIGGEAQDRVAGFWRALQITPPPEPDHLASLLGLWASLCEREAGETDAQRRSLLTHAQHTLVWEHLASWLVPYLARVADISPAFIGWADLLATLIDETLPLEGHRELPSHLAAPPGDLTDPDDIVPYVLTPIQSGFVLTRSDLGRATRSLGLGMRIGERRFSLESLLGQAPNEVVQWIAEEASRQADVYDSATFGRSIADVWSARAAKTHSALLAIAADG